MKHFLAGSVLVLGAAICAAQAPATPAQTQPTPPPDGSTRTVTGCLRAGDEPGTYELTNLRWSATSPSKDPASHHDSSPQRDRPTTPATAATGTRETPPAGETLRLAGAAASLKIDQHVGHTVTVTGMLGPADPVVRPPVVLPEPGERGDTTSRTRTSERPPADAERRVLNVRSLTHVSGTCK